MKGGQCVVGGRWVVVDLGGMNGLVGGVTYDSILWVEGGLRVF